MNNLAAKYKNNDVHAIHKIFYGVSCDYSRMVEYLEKEQDLKDLKGKLRRDKEKEMKPLKPWEPLEDYALKGKQDDDAYKYIKS